MAKLFDMLQERETATVAIRAKMDAFDGKEMPAEDKAALAKMETDFDDLNSRILAEQKQLDRERLAGEPAAKQSPAGDQAKAKLREAFSAVLRSGAENDMRVYNALQMDNPTQAGYLVPDELFVNQLISDIADATIVRKNATVYSLNGAKSMGFPTRTAGMSSSVWGTEISAPTADSSLAFGKREFVPRPASSLILLSNTLVRNAPNVDAIVRGEIAREMAAFEETAFMTGDGATQPLGLFTASANGIPTSRDVSTGNTATEMKIDGLLNAKYSLHSQYLVGAKWLVSRAGVLQLAKLKDSDGQYIWHGSIVTGAPDTMFGDPVLMSEYAPSTFTTGQYVALYGNLKNYWIVDSLAMQIKVLSELYALTNQIAYITRIETDGAPVMPTAFARVKLA